MAPSPPWSDLPQDICYSILQRLNSMEVLAFSSVCSNWRSTAAYNRHLLSPKSPFLALMLPSPDHLTQPQTFQTQRLSFHLHSHYLQNKRLCGFSNGWLILSDHLSNLSLVNPSTGIRIPLPSPLTIQNVAFKVEGERWKHKEFIRKAVLSSEPGEEGRAYYVMASFSDWRVLAVWRGGEACWTPVELSYYQFQDLVFYLGKVYAIQKDGRLAVCDLDASPPKIQWATRALRRDLFDCTKYLVEASGELLLVCKEVRVCGADESGVCGADESGGGSNNNDEDEEEEDDSDKDSGMDTDEENDNLSEGSKLVKFYAFKLNQVKGKWERLKI